MIAVLALCSPSFAADVFDRHTIRELKVAVERGPAIEQFELGDAARLKPLGPAVSSPAIVIQTDEGNFAKALLAWGLRKSGEKQTPVLIIERYVTYRADRPDLTSATGKDVMLFPGFQFNFDIGQVVPAEQGGDIEFTADSVLKPLTGAKVIPLAGSLLPPVDKQGTYDPQASETVTPRDYVGSWTVNADGRWLGEWDLALTEANRITGTFVSQDSQNRYEIVGQPGAVPHNVKLDVVLANTTLQVDGYLWTKDKSMIGGTVTMAGRKFGFIAVRQPVK